MKDNKFKLAFIVLVLSAIIFLVWVNRQKSLKPDGTMIKNVVELTNEPQKEKLCNDNGDTLYMGFLAGMDSITFLKELNTNPKTNGGKVIFYYGSTQQVQLSITPFFSSLKCLNYIVLQYNGGMDALGSMMSGVSASEFNVEQKLIVKEMMSDLSAKYGPAKPIGNSVSGGKAYSYNGGKVVIKVSDQNLSKSPTSSTLYTGKNVSIYYYTPSYLKFQDDSTKVSTTNAKRHQQRIDSIRNADSNPL
jgi:hypothetical protein